jgi:hypothetical protein
VASRRDLIEAVAMRYQSSTKREGEPLTNLPRPASPEACDSCAQPGGLQGDKPGRDTGDGPHLR